jgi:hypothetical protein
VSRLIALYPARWRERYGDELLDALAARPMTIQGRLDLVRGALDAHRHPELLPGDLVPAPVGGFTDGSGVATRRDGVQLSAVMTATAAFWTAAVLVMVESRLYGGASLQGTLLLIGMTALAGAMWARAGTSWVVGLCASAMVLACVALIQAGWPGQSLGPSAEMLVLYLVVAIGGLGVAAAILSPHARAWSVWLPVMLTTLLGACYILAFTRGIALTLALLGLVSLRLGPPSLTVRRAGAAIAGGVLIVALLTVTAAATSTWVSYQGYLLACHVDRTRCMEDADRTVHAIVAEHADAAVTHLEVMANHGFQVCWTAPVEADRGCWYSSADTGSRP